MKENKEKIFMPAFSTRGEGTGMDLAIVRQNVELHGGRIIEIGEPQKGAEFLIILPININ
ncbi:ATP-binding protein [Desulfococcaceae bacterium HSG7]|nr:ATP-binding protein [Desulfococcaceae bacterium HSG7]